MCCVIWCAVWRLTFQRILANRLLESFQLRSKIEVFLPLSCDLRKVLTALEMNIADRVFHFRAKTMEISRNPLYSRRLFFFVEAVGRCCIARASPSHWPKAVSSKHLQVILSYRIAVHADVFSASRLTPPQSIGKISRLSDLELRQRCFLGPYLMC